MTEEKANPQPASISAPPSTGPSEASKPAAAAPAGTHATPPAPAKKKKAEGVCVKKPGQWVCLVKDEKGKNCEGKLKRFYDLDVELIKQFGKNAEFYRCVECHTLYRPENPKVDSAARWAER